ncbi:MAG: cytidylate kinase-like family protein [Muribaculaceae bacterium]|nr:cytidylate kinase-like family protein [Muribaculaceae bacterium]
MSNPRLLPPIVVVVGRQFGSGGRRLGKRLAAELGLAYYDKEVLTEAAQRRGFSRDIFASHDEKRPSPLRSMISHAFGVADSYQQSPMSCEAIYDAQSRVIKELAEEGGGVFVGRSADYILRDHPAMISIFLHAPAEHRAAALVKRGEVASLEKGIEMARHQDRKREEFYNYFTGRHWGRADNYHLSIDTSRLSDDAMLELIRTYLAQRRASLTQPSA